MVAWMRSFVTCASATPRARPDGGHTGATSRGTTRGSIFESDRAFDTAKGQLLSDRGVGHVLIERVLKNMPGMTQNNIRAALERLKASGHYAENIKAIAGYIDTDAENAHGRH